MTLYSREIKGKDVDSKDSESTCSESLDNDSVSVGSDVGANKAPKYEGPWDDHARKKLVSSGVEFNPHPRYWLIGGKWYDLEKFAERHPGGRQAIMDARDRFDDCTFVFEAHHVNYPRARAVLKKFQVKGYNETPENESKLFSLVNDKLHVKLLDDDAFYSVLRKRVHEYLKQNGGAGPSLECLVLFYAVFGLWLALWYNLISTGSLVTAIACGLVSAPLGGFGHNWVHVPGNRIKALLSLDTVGFSSEQWLREHNLQHHMYTNTQLDNHFKGTDPFLITDPTVERNFMQKYIMPNLTPIVLSFGMWGNYIVHTVGILKGEENIHIGKLFVPLQVALLIYNHGVARGVALAYVLYGIVSVGYFTLALMNHNAEKCVNVAQRNKSRDFGVAQLNSSADWAVNASFLSSIRFLWLNYHTVHHMFPNVCMSKHPGIQKILIETAKEFDVEYITSDVVTLFKEMRLTFANPQSINLQLQAYAGAL